jgi:hypothetical protein
VKALYSPSLLAKVLQPYLRIDPEVRGAQLGAWEPKKDPLACMAYNTWENYYI